MTPSSTFMFVALNSKGTACKQTASDLAVFVIKPSADAPVFGAKVPGGDVKSLITFYSDAMMGRYDHPETVYGVRHMYAKADPVFDPEAGILLPGDELMSGSEYAFAFRDIAGITVGRTLSPKPNLDKVLELKARQADGEPVPEEKIIAAEERAAKDARADYNRIQKHRWGLYLAAGYGIQVRLPEWLTKPGGDGKSWAQKVATSLTLFASDPDAARALRDEGWDKRMFHNEHVAPAMAAGKIAAKAEANTPDAPEGQEPVAVKSSILFQLVKGGSLTNEQVNLAEHEGKIAVLYQITRGKPRVDGTQWVINMAHTAAVESWTNMSKDKYLAVGLS